MSVIKSHDKYQSLILIGLALTGKANSGIQAILFHFRLYWKGWRPLVTPWACCIKEGVTSPLHESRLHWIHDPNPNQSHRVKPKQTVPRNNNDTVPRNNNVVRNSDSLSRNPLEPIPSTSWYNSNLSIPSASSPRKTVSAHSHSVPRIINNENTKTTQVSDNAKCSSPPSKKRRSRKRRIERRARERENRIDSFIHDACWANQRTAVPGSPVVPAGVTQSLPEAIDPISPRRTAVYPPSRIVGNSPTNDNSPF